jgi:hypothetical protein
MRAAQLHIALRNLSQAIVEVETVLKEMRSEKDPLAAHIFVSRRHYRNTPDTKGGKRREVAARLSYSEACNLGFHCNLSEWQRLMGAVPKRD